LRGKACNAGDGASCRHLACTNDNATQASLLWDQGCKQGDSISCALAAVAAGEKPAAPAKPAVTEKPTARAAPAAAVATTPAYHRNGRKTAGYALLAASAVTGSAALLIAAGDRREERRRMGPDFWERGFDNQPHHAPAILGGLALLSGVTGLWLVLGVGADEEKPAVGVAPTGLVISGKLP
jgi:hypothetical protein